jgi:hypothetical protein
VPAFTIVTVVPETVQTSVLLLVRVADRPDDEVGDRVNVDADQVRSAGSAKVIVCGALVTLNVRLTLDAAFQFVSPLWLATRVHWPPVTVVTWLFETVQIDGVVDETATARPDEAVGATENGVLDHVRLPGSVKVIVWLPLPTVIDADPLLEPQPLPPLKSAR